MKVILGLSLILNLLLGLNWYLAFQEKNHIQHKLAKRDRISTRQAALIKVQKDSKTIPVNESKVSLTDCAKKTVSENSTSSEGTFISVPENFAEKIRSIREKFEQDLEELIYERNIDAKKIADYKKAKEDFSKDQSKLWSENPTSDEDLFSIERQKKYLDLKMEYAKKIEKIFGKDDYMALKKFIDKFNSSQHDDQRSGEPIVMMEL